MEITHKNNAEGGFFLAEDGGKRMGVLSYEWASDTEFARDSSYDDLNAGRK